MIAFVFGLVVGAAVGYAIPYVRLWRHYLKYGGMG